jgi:hypothetical protein
MVQAKTTDLVRAADGNLAVVFTVPMLLPGEKEDDYEALRAAHLAELGPRTAYERSLAEDLVGYEWEFHRHRRMRNKALLADYRQLAINLLTNGSVTHTPLLQAVDQEHELLARDLVSTDPQKRLEAEEDLKTLTGRDHDELLAQAYWRSKAALAHEAKIAELERRRRALREDYRRLKSANAPLVPSPGDIDDAEILGPS